MIVMRGPGRGNKCILMRSLYALQAKLNDGLLEMFRNEYIGDTPYVSCTPSLCHHKLSARDQFLVLSSDGLYQYLSNEEVVLHVENFMERFPEGDPAQSLIEELLSRAAKKAGKLIVSSSMPNANVLNSLLLMLTVHYTLSITVHILVCTVQTFMCLHMFMLGRWVAHYATFWNKKIIFIFIKTRSNPTRQGLKSAANTWFVVSS